MKTKFSKRIISLLLSLLMLVTAFPIATVATQAATGDKYLFAYFTGDNDGQRIRFAVSEDGINYTPLYNNAPILSSTAVSETITWNGKQGWSHSKGARDPFIIAKRDSSGNIISGQYYIVATDLRVGKNNGNSYNNSKLLVWDITDISKASSAVPWNIETSGMYGNTYYSGTTLNKDYIAWAPEVTYDYSKNMYMMFWSGPLYASAKLQYVYTKDFKTFLNSNGNVIDGVNYQPEVLYSISGTNTIDGDIVYSNGNYYLVYKNETEGQIYFVKSSTLTGFAGQTATKFVDSNYSGVCFEGPELYQRADGKWVLLVDNYNVNPKSKFVMYVADKLDDFMTGSDFKGKNVTTNINNCFPRHGAVAPITSNDYNALCKAYMIDTSASNMELIAQYFTTSDVTQDATGNGFTLTNQGVTAVGEYNGKSNVAYFSNSTKTSSGSFNYAYLADTSKIYNDYVITPTKGLVFTWEAYDLGNSVSTDYYANFFNLVEDNLGPNGLTYDGTNYNHYAIKHAFLCDGMTAGISNGLSGQDNGNTIYVNENNTGKWHEYKATITKSGLTVYMDGAPYCNYDVEGIDANWFKEMLQGGRLNLGASLFNDPVFNGYMSDFKIYAVMNTDASLADVDTTLAKYETAYKNMVADINANHSIYTQLQPAYDAYVKLCKARDAYVYGEDTNVDFKTLTAKLDAAILNMVKWTSPTGNAVPAFNDGSLTNTNAYSNIVYSQKVGNFKQYEWRVNYSNRNLISSINNNQTVALYDGSNNIIIPIMYQTILEKTKGTAGTYKAGPYMVYPTTGDGKQDDLGTFKLNSLWYSNGNSDSGQETLWKFNAYFGATTYQIGNNSKTMHQGKNMERFGTKGYSNYFCYANTLSYDNSTTFVNDDTGAYSKKYNLWWAFGGGSDGITSPSQLKWCYGQVGDNCSIYVLNYKALLDATSTATGKLPATVDNYKQGGLSTLLGYIDNATAYNPNTARTNAGSASDVVSNFNNAVTPLIDNLKNSSYSSDNANYQKLRDEMDNYLADKTRYLDDAVYTAKSIADYKKVFDAAKSLFTYLEGTNYNYSNGYTQGDYAGECADALANILNEKFSALSLHSAIKSKPIYDENGKQIYSANSWLEVVGGPINVYNEVKDQTGRYVTSSATVHNSSKEEVSYNKKTDVNNQAKADNAITALGTALDEIPEECQIAFNTSVQIAEAIEQDKYSNSSELTALVAAQKKTVFAVTQDTANLYNSFYTDTQIGDRSKVFATNLSETDAATVKVLNKSNSLTAKIFNTYLQVVDKDGKVGSKSLVSTNNYGDLITVNSGVTDIPVAWTVDLYNNAECTGTPTKTITYSGFSGTALQLKTESNAVVTAKPAYDEAPASGVAVRVYNGYNNLIDVIYASSTDEAQSELASMTTSMPFYTFKGWDWENRKEVSTGIYEVKPKFDSATTVNITTVDGGASSVKAVKINSTATVSSSTPHYGWAVKNGDKYQIVAYTDGDYKFSALVDETYVPIIENGGSYYVADGATNVQLTPDNVDKFTKPAVDTIDAQSYLNSKLAQKSPFVYFQVIDKKSDSPKVKLYMRTTAGNFVNESDDSFAFGIYLTKDGNDTRFLVKARNEISGQYYCRLSEATAAYLDTAKAFVTYDYTFTDHDHDGTSYNKITTTDTYAYDNTIPVVEAIA